MKRHIQNLRGMLLIALLCVGLFAGCSDDDDDTNPYAPLSRNDPNYGYLVNSTSYRIVVDIAEQKDFKVTLNPGQLLGMTLPRDDTHVLHAIVLNEQNRAIAEYVNSFYIDLDALDNQLRDFLCSWYFEFISETGFENKYGM